MSILGIDIGNTHGSVALFRKGKLLSSIRLSSSVQKTEDEFWFFIERFLIQQQIDASQISDVVISSVVPGLNFSFQKLAEKYFKKEAFFISSDLKLNINLDIPIPQQLGADRICCSEAAFNEYKTNLIVIDFGTATTFDIISEKGDYLGGIIASGLETTNWGLNLKAAKLPKVKLEFPTKVIGKTTEHALQSGLMYGVVAMIDGLLNNIIIEQNKKFVIISTGGISQKITPYLAHKVISKPNLLMDGLYGIYKNNR